MRAIPATMDPVKAIGALSFGQGPFRRCHGWPGTGQYMRHWAKISSDEFTPSRLTLPEKIAGAPSPNDAPARGALARRCQGAFQAQRGHFSNAF